MDRTILVIVLGIVLIVCIYWLYKYALRTNQPLEKISLSGPTSVPEPATTNSSVGYYSFWLYVNSWNNNQKIIFTKGTNTSPNQIIVYIKQTTPELMCDVVSTSATTLTTTLTRSFPLQRWTHVLIGLDSNVLDCYIDGKLVTSVPLTNVVQLDTTDNVLGGSGADIYMTGFIKKTNKPTAEIAQSEYKKSNLNLQADLPNYNVDVSLIKNGEVTKKFSII
jgi:hypothetical protein